MTTFMVVFDAPDELKNAFLQNGFLRHGAQPGAWRREFVEPDGEEAREIAYELKGVGLTARWWSPA